MSKWFEAEGKEKDIVVASRIRLSRNLVGYCFPNRMGEEDKEKVCRELEMTMRGYETVSGQAMNVIRLDKLTDASRYALAERAIINKSIARKKNAMELLLSEDEGTSVVINGDDHIRIQVSKPGYNLSGVWKNIDTIDDFINEKHTYAFDDKFGYLTSYPTNLGTAMKAYVVLHLPYLSSTRKFPAILSEMSRFGITLKGAIGDGDENYGGMFVAFNQTTLGQSEESRIHMMENICNQLIRQERSLREASMESHSTDRIDQTYKAYGILKYARMLSLKDAMGYLSMLRMGAFDGCIRLERTDSLYELMISALPNQIRLRSDLRSDNMSEAVKLTEEEEAKQRADYVRNNLPNIV